MKRRTFRLRWWIALGIAVAAIAVPTAQARPALDGGGGGSTVRPSQVQQSREVSSSNGFDWRIVWIAGGTSVAACLLGAGMVRHRRLAELR